LLNKYEIAKVLKTDFAISDYDKIKDCLDKTDEILCIGDNAGESVFARKFNKEKKV